MEPSMYILEGLPFAHIVDYKSSNSSSVIGSSDSFETLLAGCVPDLGFHLPSINLHTLRLEFHANSGFTVRIELVLSEP